MKNARALVVEHQDDAGLGLFRSSLEANGLELDRVGPMRDAPVPETLEGYDALIVLGGSMGPTDDNEAPWLPATRALLVAGVEQRIPTLGICLGAQLMATALGGHVRNIPEGPEIGLCAVEFSANAAGDPLFGELSESDVPVVQWHWLEADRLPEGAELLASSAACQNQAFRVGPRAWGVQFHPEALSSTASDWAADDPQSLVDLDLVAEEVVAEVRAADPVLSTTWSEVASRFAGLAALQAVS